MDDLPDDFILLEQESEQAEISLAAMAGFESNLGSVGQNEHIGDFFTLFPTRKTIILN